MARDSAGLRVRKWAKDQTNSALIQEPDFQADVTRDLGWGSPFTVDQYPDVAAFNGFWQEITALGKDIEAHGILEWDANVDPGYAHPSVVLGSNGKIYESVQAGGQAQDPTTDTTKTYWQPALADAAESGVAGPRSGKSANYTVLTTDDGKVIEVDASGGSRTITLPDLASADNGFTVTVIKSDNSTNDVTIDGDSSDTLNGSATLVLKDQYEAVILKWTGSLWLAIGGASPAWVRAKYLRKDDANFGGVTGVVASKSANYAVAAADDGKVVEVDASGAARTITLPDLAGANNGFTVAVIKTDSSGNAVTIDGHGSDTINGAANYELDSQHEAVILKWDGTEWWVLARTERFTRFRALTFAAALAWNVKTHPNGTVTLTADVTGLTLSGDEDGGVYTLKIKQDATGGRAFPFPVGWKWKYGNAESIASGANEETVLTLRKIDGVIYPAPLLLDAS